MKSILLTSALLLTTLSSLFAQNGEINGDIRDSDKNLITFVDVLLRTESDNKVYRHQYSTDGYFTFKSVPPGNYILEVKFEDTTETRPITLDPGGTFVMHFQKIGIDQREDVVFRYLKKSDKPVDVLDVEIVIPTIDKVLAIDPAINPVGNGFSINGGRIDGTVAIRDGVKMIGQMPLIGLDLQALDAVWTGVPVRYGDFTGGAARFTTKTPTLTQRKSFEVYSSSLFNPYHHNRFHSYMTGPLLTQKTPADSSGLMNERLVLGYNLTTYFIYQKDPNPGYTGVNRLNQQTLDEIAETPVMPGEEMNSFVPSASFLDPDQLSHTKVRQHAGFTDAAVDLKLHYAPNPDLTFDLANNIRYTRSRIYSFNNSLLNEERNPLRTQTNYAGYLTVNHTLKSPFTHDGKWIGDSNDLFSDLVYSVQLDYQTNMVTTMDPTHHDRFFDYGHIGSTQRKRAPVYTYYENQPKTVTDQNGNKVVVTNYHELTGYEDTSLVFTSGNENPILARYNELVYRGYGQITNEDELIERGGLLNGQNPQNVYSLFNNIGTVTSGYSKVQFERFGLTAFTEATVHPGRNPLVKHDFQFGIQYEQYSQSYYSLNPVGLWRLMPLLANSHIEELDRSNPILTYDEFGRFTDTIKYVASAEASTQRHFDQSLRTRLMNEGYRDANGNVITETSWIDINSLDPSMFSIDMFSADELLNDGNGYVAYSGYTHTGERRRGKTSIQDFLNDPMNRPMDSYSPILSAAWLQDEFQVQEIFFRAGVRLERFDANQYVLADPYTLFAAKTAGQTRSENPRLRVADNVGDDYIVYVDDAGSPNKITGYRNGDQWYDANGVAINNPEVLATQSSRGAVQPLLVNPFQTRIDKFSFKEYAPALNILPRLSFYFPVNSTAMFYANYDKLAQRPPDAQTFTPLSTYYNFQSAASGIIPNASLKPRVKTDYLVGFKQLIGKHGTVNISANYSSIQNDFNQIRINQAYPYSYTTYANVDFSTVKSFKVTYQHMSDHVVFILGYNLQYADGTGSNINSAQTLIQSGQPNLRSLYPLSFDTRHSLKGSISLYGTSRNPDDRNKKPATTWDKIKHNAVISFNGRSFSGLPYTSIAQPVSEGQASLGLVQRSQVKGNPYGSRMPWKIYLDARIEKTFVLKTEELIPGVVVPRRTLDAFLVADNLFNLKIIENVYRFTGRPDDDGYLNSPVGQQQAENQLNLYTFQMLYDLKLNNPLNYYNPRMIQIGFRYNFL